MDLAELYQYVLDRRRDDEAFYAYIDRSKAAGRMIQVNVSDPNWENELDEKMKERHSYESGS